MGAFNMNRAGERRFLPDPDNEGGELFHPWGSFGPAIRVIEPDLRARVLRLTVAYHALLHLGYYLWFVGVGFRDTDDRLMLVAPLLLWLAVVLMGYRVALRALTKGCETGPNRWTEITRNTEDRGHWLRFALLYLLIPFLLLNLGGLLARALA